MNEKTKDSDKEKGDHQSSPTDWDWMMFLSGEINAIETLSYTFFNMFIGVLSVAIVVLIALLGISYSNQDSTNPSIVVSIAVVISLAIISFHGYRINRSRNKYIRRAEDRVKLLEECRDEIFDRLDDPNKIVERCFKKGDENK